MRCLKVVLLALFTAVLIPGLLQAQTASTGAVTGTIFDKTGAVIPKASVELRDSATNIVLSATANDVGHYVFTAVKPGTYQLKVMVPGFRQAIVNELKVAVGMSASVNVTLEPGAVKEVVEVHASTATELQTLDSAVGNVLDRRTLENIPSLSRDATALLLLQPMTTPGFNGVGSPVPVGEGDGTGGQVSGARSDQNTFLVDGGDATDSTAGGGQYSGTNFTASPRAVVPTPVESLEEFRVVTSNPTAGFARSAGGEVEMVTKRGSNAFHGAAYEYLQNTVLNANTWTRNSLRQKNPALRDNRFGARVGGPIWKDKTFFFAHYEGRRFFLNQDIRRLVPSETMKAGILRFRDASGNIVSYNLATSTACGPNRTPCDPRGLGLSPVIAAVWKFEPTGNDPGRGDGLNTIGFTAPAPTPISEEFGVARLDHKISQNWQFMTSFRYSKTDLASPVQLDIGGLLPGHTKGQPVPTAKRPLAPRYLVAGVTGQITSHLTSDFRFDWLRHWWEWGTKAPFPQVTGTDAALSIGGEGIGVAMVPINVDTQNARSRLWNGHDYNFFENLSWMKGNHMLQFGGRAGTQRFFHRRDDKVVGALTSPVYTVGRLPGGSGISIPGANRPPTCNTNPLNGPVITTNCLSRGDVQNWNNFYASVLGMVDRGSRLLTRGPDFSPNTPGTPLLQHTIVDSYQLYFSDTWRVDPSFTLTWGLTWGVQLPPFEETGQSTIMVDHATGKPIVAKDYLTARAQAAVQGKIFNPQFDFVPIRQTGRKYPYDPDWTNFGPRVAAAWNPSASSGLLGRIFGDRKAVIRGGYARVYDRINGVGIVMIPALGIGFGNTVRCRGPRIPVAGVVSCRSGANPSNSFRIGTDGTTVPLPSLTKLTPPLIPGDNSPFELLDFRIDPRRKVGYSDSFDLSIQRELPGNMLLEVGYVGRVAKKLYQGFALSHVPYMMTDPRSKQTFAQAFSAVANALRNDQPVTPQPFFENFFGSGATASFAADKGSFQDANVFDVWDTISGDFPASVFLPGSLPGGGAHTNQVFDSYWIGSDGRSNYNAAFLTLRKRTSHGLAFDLNYTFSHAFDQVGQNQESLNEASDAFNLDRDYGSAQFDRRHVLNTLVTYELPFGQGKRFSSGGWADKLIGGWIVSGVYVYGSGLPIDVFNGNSCEEYGQGPVFGNCSGYRPIGPGVLNATPHNGVTGSGGIGVTGNVNAFGNPASVFNNFRTPDIFKDGRVGRGFIRSMGRWNIDFGLSKSTKITERISTRFDVQMTNVFNHPLLSSDVGIGGSTDIFVDKGHQDRFGVLASQYNQPRFIQFGLRFDF